MKQIRTTIVLPEEDIKKIKILAATHNLTMSQVVQKSLQQVESVLKKKTSPPKKPGEILMGLAGSLNLSGKEPPTRQEIYDRYLDEKLHR